MEEWPVARLHSLFHMPSLSEKHELILQAIPTCVHVLKSVKSYATFIGLPL
jgi:hypothetical protein